MTKYLWLMVEADEYELPLAVADSARELGEMVGSNKHNVETNVCKGNTGRLSGVKYLKVLNYEDTDNTDTPAPAVCYADMLLRISGSKQSR